MKVLITGGSSLLGRYLLATAPAGVQVEATWYTNYVGRPMYHMDVGDRSQVDYVFSRVQPDVVIHCAAIGSVDYAEQNWQVVHRANVAGTENVLRAADGRRVAFISSNAVFGGDEAPYREDAVRKPVNRYGRLKAEAEDLVMATSNGFIVRPFLLYGWPWNGGRGNWATIVVDKLRNGQAVSVVDDTVVQPTYVADCAWAIWELLGVEPGVYHVAGADTMTLYGFAVCVAEVFGLDETLITQVSTMAFPGIAPRPVDSTYDLSKIHGLDIWPSDVRDGLERMKRDRDFSHDVHS